MPHLLACQGAGGKKAGAPVLENPRLDAVLAAADASCFATYIMRQGGVLVPRKHHLVRTAYELNDEPSAQANTMFVFMTSGPRSLRAGSAPMQ